MQVKSASEPEVQYGGVGENGEWNKHEIDWLYGQDQPILLCIVDLKQLRVRLYSTVMIWYRRWLKGPPGKVILVPGLRWEDPFDGRSESEPYRWGPLDNTVRGRSYGDNRWYRVPLGPPIVDVIVQEQEPREFRDKVRACIIPWVDIDYRNITHYHLRVPYTEEWLEWQTNVPPITVRYRYVWNGALDKNVPAILKSIAPAIRSLQLHLQEQGQQEKLGAVEPIAHLIEAYGLGKPPWA